MSELFTSIKYEISANSSLKVTITITITIIISIMQKLLKCRKNSVYHAGNHETVGNQKRGLFAAVFTTIAAISPSGVST